MRFLREDNFLGQIARKWLNYKYTQYVVEKIYCKPRMQFKTSDQSLELGLAYCWAENISIKNVNFQNETLFGFWSWKACWIFLQTKIFYVI